MSLFESASLVVTPNGTKASKLYAIKPTDGSGDLTVTRATTATRVNASGLISSVASNVPRLDYTNSTCPSILVEPQRTNLLTYSEQFDNAAWSNKAGVTITANSSTAPNGTTTADRFVGTGGSWYFAQPISLSSGISHTLTVYVKSNTGSNQTFRLFGNDISTSSNLTATTAWQRFELVFTSGAFTNHGITRDSSNNNVDLLVWGAQLEAGSYATSYIPTVASAVTRNADVISKTGISSLIGQTEGTLFMDCKINALPVDGSLFGIQKNSSNFVIRLGSQGTNIYAQSYNGSANLFFEATPYTLGSRVKAAFAYKAGSYAFYVNGIQIATGSNATAIPACDATMFNSLWGSFNDSLSFYSAAGIWKERLTNVELAQLTTI